MESSPSRIRAAHWRRGEPSLDPDSVPYACPLIAAVPGPSAWASPGMRLYALAGVRSVVATTGTIPERRMAGLGPRARVCGWPANEVRAVRLIRWVPLVVAGEQAAVA